MGARRRAARAADRAAAARAGAGWSVLTWSDAVPVAWTRAWSATPQRWGDRVHRGLAGFCGPAFLVGLIAPIGWFHRDEHRVVVRLRPFRRQPWWPVLVGFLVYQLVGRVLSELVGAERLLPWFGGLLLYALLVALCTAVARRELTTRAERQGYWRVHDDVAADWVLSGLAVRSARAGALLPVGDLIDARVPASATVLVWSAAERRDRELATIGFETVGSKRGHLVRSSAGSPVGDIRGS